MAHRQAAVRPPPAPVPRRGTARGMAATTASPGVREASPGVREVPARAGAVSVSAAHLPLAVRPGQPARRPVALARPGRLLGQHLVAAAPCVIGLHRSAARVLAALAVSRPTPCAMARCSPAQARRTAVGAAFAAWASPPMGAHRLHAKRAAQTSLASGNCVEPTTSARATGLSAWKRCSASACACATAATVTATELQCGSRSSATLTRPTPSHSGCSPSRPA